jgi:hypothetical protein
MRSSKSVNKKMNKKGVGEEINELIETALSTK